MAETSFGRISHPERNTRVSNIKFRDITHVVILQQTEGSANLIKLRNHAHSDYGLDLVDHRVDFVDPAFHFGGIPVFMADRYKRCVICLVECVPVAD